MKFVILLVVLLVAVALIWNRGTRRRDRASRPPPSAAADKPQAMLRCAHCGVHLPAADAIRRGEHDYCSVAHRDAGPRA